MTAFKNEIQPPKERIKSFSEWDGSWASYKEYLAEKGKLSMNFTKSFGEHRLREGYTPEWKLKDFV